MITPAEAVVRYLEVLKAGDLESARCGMEEAGAQVLPYLVAAYDEEKSPHVRAGIVRLIWEHRKPQSLAFLARVLDDPSPEVKKVALDGLVTLGGSGAREVLKTALSQTDPKAKWAQWLREAIDQVNTQA